MDAEGQVDVRPAIQGVPTGTARHGAAADPLVLPATLQKPSAKLFALGFAEHRALAAASRRLGQLALHVAPRIALSDIASAVMQLLAAGQPEFELGAALR